MIGRTQQNPNEIIKSLIEKGLWPENKKLVKKSSVPYSKILEEVMHLPLIYSGKVAELYYIGEKDGEELVLKVMSDRVSVFDIPLSENIAKKGVFLNQIVNTNLKILKKLFPSLKTAIVATEDVIYDYIGSSKDLDMHDLAERSQVIALKKPHVAKLFSGNSELEWIFRNHLTGSLFKAYESSEEPYGLGLIAGLSEWYKFSVPVFTPTTKDISDTPVALLNIDKNENQKIETLKFIFSRYTKLLETAGITLVDTKFEISTQDENGAIILIDEFLTPDTSRFILKTDFEKASYNSLDKQVLRDWAKSESIDKKGVAGQTYQVKIPEEVKDKTINAYSFILTELQEIETKL